VGTPYFYERFVAPLGRDSTAGEDQVYFALNDDTRMGCCTTGR
jgi:hypothetical protein